MATLHCLRVLEGRVERATQSQFSVCSLGPRSIYFHLVLQYVKIREKTSKNALQQRIINHIWTILFQLN